LWLGRAGSSNVIVLNFVLPLSGALVLLALSYWQVTELSRLTFRMAIMPFLLVWTVLTVAFNETSRFSGVAGPMANLVGLGAAAFTLLAKSRRASSPLQHCDWFWVSGGMALFFGAASALGPLSALLATEAPEMLVRAYELKSILDAFAFLAVARGVTCPLET
jgi:hypothetical protein